MRDLFSGCAYIHTYVHMFWSHLGMSIYGDTRNVNLQTLMLRNSGVTDMCTTQGSQWTMELWGQCFLVMEDGEDSAA